MKHQRRSRRLVTLGGSFVGVVALLALTAGCGDSGDGGSDAAASPGSTTPASSPGAACTYSTSGAAARKVNPPSGNPGVTKPVDVTLETNRGEVPMTLSADKTPCTVNSFLSLADQDYFDKTPCHRLTTQGIFVLQCGDPTGTGSGGPGYRFPDELLKADPRTEPCHQVKTGEGKTKVCTYQAGTVAMANAGPDTNGSQFFLVYKDSPLPPSYTVFGQMTAAGLKTVQQVAKAGVQGGADDGPPAKKVTIRSVQLPQQQGD